MNAVVIINVGGYLCENSRASIRAAAARWQADYVEVTNNSHPHLHPTFAKCPTIQRLTSYERVVYFDADMLIRGDAPSPFACLDDPTKLYVVRDLERIRPYSPRSIRYDVIAAVRGAYYRPVRERVKREVDYDQYIRRFFNAGFFVASPEHHRELFKVVESNFPPPETPMPDNAHFEQALFNYVVQLVDPSVICYAPETWNYIDPDIREKRMDSFVYHFTGANYLALKPAIHSFPWTA